MKKCETIAKTTLKLKQNLISKTTLILKQRGYMI